MKHKVIFSAVCVSLLTASGMYAQEARELQIFDNAKFYDGYEEAVQDSELTDGILRHTNYLYARRLTDADLAWFGTDLTMEAIIGAACDNYDRLGNVNLALVPKGQETYVPSEVTRIEVARFITPFMQKNASIKEVPYLYNVPGLSLILRDGALREKYDFWMEFEVFGIPYSAQQQVAGCKGRNDVFKGSLKFISRDEPAGLTDDNVLVPINMKTTEIFGPINFNSYREEACDTLGIPSRTYTFTVPEDLADARIILITSNHGANENGEEYNRRHHFVYIDGEIAFDYTPGGVSCEPYRKYNTQPNFIYGYMPDMDFWLNYSNWCPGQAVPVREIHLGAVKAGEHKLMLRVPDAIFADNQGDFYVSAYLQGARKGTVPSEVPELAYKAGVTFSREGDTVYFRGEEKVAEVAVYDNDGRLVYGKHNPGDSMSFESFADGIYILSARTSDGRAAVYKMVK